MTPSAPPRLRRTQTGGAALILAAMAPLAGPGAACAAPAPQGKLTLDLHATGGLTADVQAEAGVDATHLCALSPQPDGRKAYLLVYGKPPAATLLDRAGPGLVLTVADAHLDGRLSGQAGDTIQAAMAGHRFLGLGLSDPAFHLSVSLAADGSGGQLEATHLLDESGTIAISLAARWRCPLHAGTALPNAAAAGTGPAGTRNAAATPGIAATDGTAAVGRLAPDIGTAAAGAPQQAAAPASPSAGAPSPASGAMLPPAGTGVPAAPPPAAVLTPPSPAPASPAPTAPIPAPPAPPAAAPSPLAPPAAAPPAPAPALPATPAAPPQPQSDKTPQPPRAQQPSPRLRTGAEPRIGHFRIVGLEPCDSGACLAELTDLDGGRAFQARVDITPLHLAASLAGLARKGQIELLVSGELVRGPHGTLLRALHLEGVAPHAEARLVPAEPAPRRAPPHREPSRRAPRSAPRPQPSFLQRWLRL